MGFSLKLETVLLDVSPCGEPALAVALLLAHNSSLLPDLCDNYTEHGRNCEKYQDRRRRHHEGGVTLSHKLMQDNYIILINYIQEK